MNIKLNLLEERASFVKEQFGDKVKASEPNSEGFVELEFEVVDEWEVLNIFHAGFQCGWEAHKETTSHLF
jgi:hypothetical protein